MNLFDDKLLFTDEEEEQEEVQKPSFFSIPAPSTVNPLESEVGFTPTIALPDDYAERVKRTQERVSSISYKLDSKDDEVGKKKAELLQSGSLDEEKATIMARASIEIKPFNDAPEEVRKVEIERFSNENRQRIIDNILSAGMPQEDNDIAIERVNAVADAFIPNSKKFVVTPNGTTTAAAIFSNFWMLPGSVHKKEKTDWYYMTSNKDVRREVLNSLDENSGAYKLVKAMDDAIDHVEKEGSMDDLNYYNAQEFFNNIGVNLVSYGMDALRVAGAGLGISAPLAALAGASKAGAVALGATAFLLPAVIISAGMMAYYGYQAKEESKMHSEYFRLLPNIDAGKYTFEQISKGFENGYRPEFINTDGTLNKRLLDAAREKGIDTGLNTASFPTYNLHKYLGKGTALFHAPRGYEYDSHSIKGDVTGEIVGTALVTLPLAMLDRRASVRHIISRFSAAEGLTYYSTKAARSIIAQSAFDVMQGYTMEGIMSNDALRNVMESTREMPYGFIVAPMVQQAINVGLKSIGHTWIVNKTDSVIANAALAKASKEYQESLRVLRFAGLTDTSAKAMDDALQQATETANKGIKVGKWADVVHAALKDSTDPAFKKEYRDRMYANLNASRERAFEDLSMETSKFSTDMDAIGTLKSIIHRSAGDTSAAKMVTSNDTIPVEYGRAIVSTIMDDSKFLNSTIEKYTDEKGVEKIGLFRSVEVAIPGTQDVLRLKIGIDDMVEIYNKFYPRAEGDTKVGGPTGRISRLQGLEEDFNRVLLSNKPLSSLTDLSAIIGKNKSMLHDLVATKQLSIESLDVLRDGFVNNTYTKLLDVKELVSDEDFNYILNKSSESASYSLGDTALERAVSPIVNKITNMMSSIPSLYERFHKKNTSNKAAIMGAFLSDMMEKHRSIIRDEDATPDAKSYANRSMANVLKEVAPTLIEAYSKEGSENSDYKAILDGFMTKLTSGEQIDEFDLKNMSITMQRMSAEAGDVDSYKGILSDLVRVQMGKEDPALFISDRALQPGAVDNLTKRMNTILIDPSLTTTILSSIAEIRESGFGGLYTTLKSISSDQRFIDINVLELLNIKNMLGYSTATPTIGKVTSASNLKLNKFHAMLFSKNTKLTKETVKKASMAPDVSDADKKYLKDNFTYDQLNKMISEAAISRRIGYKALLDMQATRSMLSGESLKSIPSALLQLHNAVTSTSPDSEGGIRRGLKSMRFAIPNSSKTADTLLKIVEDVASRLLATRDSGEKEKALRIVTTLLRDTSLSIKNKLITDILDDEGGLITSDIAKIYGLVALKDKSSAEFLSKFFSLTGEPGSLLKQIAGDDVGKGSVKFLRSLDLVSDVMGVSGSKMHPVWSQRNEDARAKLIDLWSSISGKEETEAINKALASINEKISTSSERMERDGNNASVLDYEMILRYMMDKLKENMFDKNKDDSDDPNRQNSLFSASGREEFMRKLHLSYSTVESIPKISKAYDLLLEQTIGIFRDHMSGSQEKTDDAVNKAVNIVASLTGGNKAVAEKMEAIMKETIEPFEKLLKIEAETKLIVEGMLQRSLIASTLSNLGFGGLRDDKIDFLTAAKQVAETTKNVPLLGILPHLKLLSTYLDSMKEMGNKIAGLGTEVEVGAALKSLMNTFAEFKESANGFRENKIFNLMDLDDQTKLYDAITNTTLKAEKMIKKFHDTFTSKTTSEATKAAMQMHARDYFSAALGYTDFLNTTLKSFVSNLVSIAEKQNNMLFDDNVTSALRKAFASIDEKKQILALDTRLSQSEHMFSDHSVLSKTSHKVKQIWNSISNSTLYNKKFKRTVFDPYYGLNPEFTSNFRQFNIERDDIVARIGTIAARLGLDPKKPKSIAEFGRSMHDFVTFKAGDTFDQKRLTSFNVLFNEDSGIRLTDTSSEDDILNAKTYLVSKVMSVGAGKKADWKNNVAARNVAVYLDAFEKTGILDLVLEHSAEYCVSKDKLNSFSTNPELAQEKEKMLQTWDQKLRDKIYKKTGRDPSVVMQEIRQQIKNTIGPEASLEDALVFNSMIVTDFTGKLVMAAAVDDNVLKYVSEVMPKLYDGATQIRNLVDYANIIGVKYGEYGLDTLSNYDRSNLLVKLIGTEDTNYTRLVDNPMNVQGQKFYIMSHLQHAMEALQSTVYKALSGDGLIDNTLTAESLSNPKKSTYYITLPALTKGASGNNSSNIYVKFPLSDPSTRALGKRAVFASFDEEKYPFMFLQAGDASDNTIKPGMTITEKDGVITVKLDGTKSNMATTYNATHTVDEIIDTIFPSQNLVISIKNDLNDPMRRAFAKVIQKAEEAKLDINEMMENINPKTIDADSIFSLMKSYGSEGATADQKKVKKLFDEHISSEDFKIDLGEHTMMTLNTGNFRLGENPVKLLGVGANVVSIASDSKILENAADMYLPDGITRESFNKETIRNESNAGKERRTKSSMELYTIAALNEKLLGTDPVPINKAELETFYRNNMQKYNTGTQSGKTIVINGVKIENVVRIMDFDEYTSADRPQSGKPDIVIETIKDGTRVPIFVSHKATNADFIDSSSAMLKHSVVNSTLVNGLMSGVQQAVIDKLTKELSKQGVGEDALTEAVDTKAVETIQTILKSGYSIADVVDIATLTEAITKLASETDSLARAFGTIIKAKDMQENAMGSASPFSRQGIPRFMTNFKDALVNAAKAAGKTTTPFSELLKDESFKDSVWQQLSKTNPWMKAYASLEATPEKFTDLTQLFLRRVFLEEDVTKATEGNAKDIISILKTLGNIDDPETTRKKPKKSGEDEEDLAGSNSVSTVIDKLIKNSYATKRAEIGNFDHSISQLLSLKPDIFHNLQTGVTSLVQKIQLGNFVNRMMMDTGALRYIGRVNTLGDDHALREDERNGLIKLVTLGSLRQELQHVFPEFVKLIMKSDKFQADMIENLFDGIYTARQGNESGVNPANAVKDAITRYYNTIQKVMNNNPETDSIRLAISKDLYEQLSFLNQKMAPKNIGNTFGAQFLDSVNSLMTYFTTNFSGAVLVLNHISWYRNVMGAFLQASLSTGDVFTGLAYTVKALNDMKAYRSGGDSGKYGQFLQDNKPKPLTMARYGVTAHSIDMSTLDRERHAAFKMMHTVFNKPMEILNSGIYKTLGALTGKDPTNIEAQARAMYGQIDNMTRYAIWLMAKEGKVRAPEDYSSISKLISEDYALKRSIEKAFSSDVVHTITSNGKYLSPMSDSDASAFARKFSFVYDELPDAWKLIKAVWNPFASFTYNSYRILYNSMTTYPARVAGLYLALSVANNAILQDGLGIDVSLNSFIPNLDVFSWVFGDEENMDFLNVANPSAPFIRFARSITAQRDPYTGRDMSSFGAAELWLRSYVNSFLPVSPSANVAARWGINIAKNLLGYEDSPFAEREVRASV